jgi:hypothetical protein
MATLSNPNISMSKVFKSPQATVSNPISPRNLKVALVT